MGAKIKGWVAGLVGLMLLASGMFLPLVQAQGGLTPEQEALMERALLAMAARQEYESYVRVESELQQQNLTISVPAMNLTQVQVNKLTREITSTVIQSEDNRNILSNALATLAETTFGADNTSQESIVTLEAEIRLVDGALYVNAAYVDPAANLPALPTGWIEATNPTNFPALEALGLEGYLQPGLFSDPSLMRPAVQDVLLEKRILEDGRSADYIILDLGYEGIQTMLGRDVDPNDVFTAFLLLSVNENSTYTLTVGLDENDLLIEANSEANLRTEQVDAHALRPADFPEGTFIKFEGRYVENSTFSQINDGFEPVTVPENLGG